MDIKNEKLLFNCPFCEEQIVLTINTRKCPKCDHHYSKELVENTFFDYESQLLNSEEFKKHEKKLHNANSTIAFGQAMSSCGCIIFLLPLGAFLLWIAFEIIVSFF